MEAVNKLVAYVIPIVVLILLVVYFYGGSGAFGKVKDVFNKTKSYLPDVSLGAEKLSAEKPTIPPKQEKALRLLITSMESMLRAPEPCLGLYPAEEAGGGRGLPPLGDTIVEFSPGRVSVSTGKGQVVTDLGREFSTRLSEFTPCIVDLETSPGVVQYIAVPKISIAFKAGTFFGGENWISYPAGGESVEEKLPGAGFLYTPGSNYVCFVSKKVTAISAGSCTPKSVG